MAIDHDTIIEGFVIDPSFVDQTKLINEIFTNETGKVASLTQKALSYFSQTSVFKDPRTPSTRDVNWFAESVPSVVLDEAVYETFIDAANGLGTEETNGFFKLVDYLMFNYDPTQTTVTREAALVGDADIAAIYVPNSFEISNTLVEGEVFFASGTTDLVDVPASIKFSVTLPVGQTTSTFVITLFASVEAWLTGYNVSTVVKVIPPLTYSQIYSSSITTSVDNIFATGAMAANLSYNTTQSILGTVQVSGIVPYNAVITDVAGNTVAIPFNILYKGRSPTLNEIRAAIRTELLGSGVGNQAGWEARIPGVFVAGRFYLIPFWDLSYEKPDQDIFPSILDYTVVGEKTNRIMEPTGFGDILEYTNVLPVYYNRMTVSAVPDLTGIVDIQKLNTVIPDYQSYAPQDENFAYLSEATRDFSRQLNEILAIDTNGTVSGIYIPITENLLTFYSFVVEKYEFCVITKLSYTTQMESIS